MNRRPLIGAVESADIKAVLLRGKCTLHSKPGFLEAVRHILHQSNLSHRLPSDSDLDPHRRHACLGILFGSNAALPVRYAKGLGRHYE